MEEKVRFVVEYERDEQTMSELCESFGISRETGYVWLRRYRGQGLAGLLELNRWKKQDVFLTEVLWGERIGLLPVDERCYTVFFAQVPLCRFDSWQRRVLPLPKTLSFDMDGAGEGDVSPSPAPQPLKTPREQKVSGMCPV